MSKNTTREYLEEVTQDKSLVCFKFKPTGKKVVGHFIAEGNQIISDSKGNPQQTFEFQPNDNNDILCLIPEQVQDLHIVNEEEE